MLLFALALIAILGMASVAVDGSFGLIQVRRAQNAADFAAFAGAQQLNGSSVCDGSGATPTKYQMVQVVQDTVNANAAGVGTSWSAQFLDGLGRPISGGTFTPGTVPATPATYPPPGACGLAVTANPQWKPFLAGILGVQQMTGQAGASVAASTTGLPVSIVALNKVGPHAILGGGAGNFIVSGDMYLNTQVINQPWTQSFNGWQYDDAIDAKTSSNLFVFGTIHSSSQTYNGQNLWPLDTCFGSSPLLGNGKGSGVAFQAGDPPPDSGDPGDLPTFSPTCGSGTTNVSYNHIDPTVTAINDPLQGGAAPPNPALSATAINCPGMSLQTFASVPNGATVLQPGEYTNPVKITTAMTFGDCSAYAGEAAYPGIYRFDKGLWIDPAAGLTVTGSNVVLTTVKPYPIAGNVPGTYSGGVFTATGSGNGAPCLPGGTMSSSASGGGSPMAETDRSSAAKCAGTVDPTSPGKPEYGALVYDDSSYAAVSGVYGTGENYGLIIGGGTGSHVNLTGPTTGTWSGSNNTPGLVLYQDPGTQANDGFNGLPGDAAIINVTGVIYDSSLTNYGSSAPLQYWDGTGGGIPLYGGGTLQTGNGAGWSGGGPTQSAGSFTVDGTCIVDQFNTDGATTITILGRPYTLPGSGGLSLIG